MGAGRRRITGVGRVMSWTAVDAGPPRTISLPSNARKSVVSGVDIGERRDYGFSRSQKDRRARQTRTARQKYVVAVGSRSTQLQYAGRFGGGVAKPERLQDGDGTDDRTGWPAVIRGCHEQYRQYQQ